MLLRLRIKIHGKFLGGANIVDELPVSATHVQNGTIRGNQILKEIVYQHPPDAIAIFLLRIKPSGVDVLQVCRIHVLFLLFLLRRRRSEHKGEPMITRVVQIALKKWNDSPLCALFANVTRILVVS